MAHPGACATVIRRFAGPTANELAMLCRPDARSPGTACQAEAAYRALAALLTTQHASFRDLTSETLFLQDVRHDLPHVLGARTRVLGDLGQSAAAPPPTFIGQAPVAEGALVELSATAVIPHDRQHWSVRDVQSAPSCACAGCARSGARLVRLGDQTVLHTTNVYGAGGDAFEQASNMFRAAERLLDQCGMEPCDVVRTWIHLRDIERDYDALNTARRAFFRRCRIELRPASTGVQGIPFPDAHDCSMSLYAVKSLRPLDVTSMSAPTLNEAWSYGADFSRGVRITEANKVALYVSGTASIDEAGRTVHVGDFESQVERMLTNIAALLEAQGACFGDVVSAVTYLKRPSDGARLRSLFHERGFDGFPTALVAARICRAELLCETEVVAALPLPQASA